MILQRTRSPRDRDAMAFLEAGLHRCTPARSGPVVDAVLTAAVVGSKVLKGLLRSRIAVAVDDVMPDIRYAASTRQGLMRAGTAATLNDVLTHETLLWILPLVGAGGVVV